MVPKRSRRKGLDNESKQDQSLVDNKTKSYDFNSRFLHSLLHCLKERPLNSLGMEFHILIPAYLINCCVLLVLNNSTRKLVEALANRVH